MNKEKLEGLLEVSCCTYHDGLCGEVYDYVIELQQENQQLKEMQCPFLGTGCKRELEQLKKQKDDVVEYIKNYITFRKEFDLDKLLRMLGEIDV